mgnify:CR=1 FL=1
MDPFFTEEQLNNMSRENMMEVMRIMQNQVRKKELEFMNAMLSDRLFVYSVPSVTGIYKF